MWKTRRGRDLIEKIGMKYKFWILYGRISLWICFSAMIALMLLLIWEAYIVLSIPKSFAPSPELMLGIPGLNPIIPLWYGILGLAVGIFVHEFAHGILSGAGRIKVESLGILLLIVPIGAFVEPNEDQLKETTRFKRSRLFAAGPATNIIVAFICLIILLGLLAPAAKPVHEGAIVLGIGADSPADHFGVSIWSEVIAVDDMYITNASELQDIIFEDPGERIKLEIYYRGELSTLQLPAGVVLNPLSEGPANDAGIRNGMIIESLNDQTVNSLSDLKEIIERSPNDRSVNITVLEFDSGMDWYIENESIASIAMVSKYDYYQEYYPDYNKEEYRNMSYMGITSSTFGIAAEDSDFLISITAHPFSDIDSSRDLLIKPLRYIALPFFGYTPIKSPMTELYEVTGALSVLPQDIYWIIVNCFYWVFWLNLMLGLFNALPAVPLDGGYIFKDTMKGFFERMNRRKTRDGRRASGRAPMSDEQMERVTNKITLLISVFVLFLILWQLIGPRI